MPSLLRGETELALDSLVGEAPRVVFCAGFNSSRHGNKALALEQWCAEKTLAYVRFDYLGHGDSGGDFADGTISEWLADTLAVIDASDQDTVLVGSSMGGWLALLAALRRPQVKGLLLLACAADMTHYYPARLADLHAQLDEHGRRFYAVENQYDDGQPYRIYQNLLDDGEQHLLLNKKIPLSIPIRMVHGQRDDVVEWQRSMKVMELLKPNKASLTLLEQGDHRLSTTEDLNAIKRELAELIAALA